MPNYLYVHLITNTFNLGQKRAPAFEAFASCVYEKRERDHLNLKVVNNFPLSSLR